MGVTDTVVRGMVHELKPTWSVESIERSSHGLNFVVMLDVRTPNGERTAVLKAMTTDLAPKIARSEPRLLDLVSRRTSIPVPTVFGYCDQHEEYPAPFFLMSHVEGENYQGRPERLSSSAHEQILREAGQNLAELHMLGSLPAVGHIGVQDKQLTVLETDAYPRYDDFRDWVLAYCEETLDSLASGTQYPELADDPTRFADLVPDVREYVHETVPELPPPEPSTYCHWDYRYGNLLIDPETGATEAVLDWGDILGTDPVYNLAKAESLLLYPEREDDTRTEAFRQTFRTAYTETRENWSFDASASERISVYQLVCRLYAMTSLPLWLQNATPEERDARATEHRAFITQYV